MKEEEEVTKTVQNVPANKVSMSSFLVTGLDLEAQQYE